MLVPNLSPFVCLHLIIWFRYQFAPQPVVRIAIAPHDNAGVLLVRKKEENKYAVGNRHSYHEVHPALHTPFSPRHRSHLASSCRQQPQSLRQLFASHSNSRPSGWCAIITQSDSRYASCGPAACNIKASFLTVLLGFIRNILYLVIQVTKYLCLIRVWFSSMVPGSQLPKTLGNSSVMRA